MVRATFYGPRDTDTQTGLRVLVPRALERAVQAPSRGRVKGVESHVSRFWDPRMRRQILEHLHAGGEGLSDVSRAALVLLGAEGRAAPAIHANEDGTGGDAG